MPEITMPRLSDTMEDGVVSAWLKQVGDQITRGEVVAEIETDKALMELEAYEDGVLERILAEPGVRIPIGEPIAIVGDGSGAGAAGAAATASAAAPASVVAQASSDSSGSSATAAPAAMTPEPSAAQPDSVQSDARPGERKKSSPLARKIARELGVDFAAVVGTGPGGRITRQDVEAAHRNGASALAVSSAPGAAASAVSSVPAAASGASAVPSASAVPDAASAGPAGPGASAASAGPAASAEAGASAVSGASAVPASTPAAPSVSAPSGSDRAASSTAAQSIPASGDYDEIPLTNIQRVSATRLTESKQHAPHIYLTSAIDVTGLLAFRAQINETLQAAGEGKVSVNDLLVKAVASTLRKDPSVNVSFAGDKLLRHKGIHLGIAVATPVGLLVPVIRDADRKSVSEIASDSRDKATRARDRKLRADEMSGGTFTISNLGMFGIEQFTAVINPPESAILAVGGAADEVRLVDGEVVTRKILRVTLSADHRAIDGAVAAQFLAHLKELLEHPLRIVT
ncbi:2-oxo acid dehydrogenase subunit E2 [Nocardia sp. NBC_01499]|uniref:dihydrolipoamide acetyltransferase family protein n=1 Tax=Nocardia sp. NBC_01499 TaxID=2903597 RepID=UPI00386B895C